MADAVEAHTLHAVGQPLAWTLVIGLIVIDVFWSVLIGLSVSGLWKAVNAVCGLLALSISYRRRSRGITEIAESAALWISFTAAGCLLTYLFAACALPPQDVALTNIDHAIGFDWLVWRNAALAWPALHQVLLLAYAGLMPQILLSIMFFPAIGRSERGSELFLFAMLTLLPTALISALCPALGPFATFGGDDAGYLPHLLALRAGGPWQFNLLTMQGIITMPSYHAVLAVLFTHAYRNTGMIGWGIAGLNGLMLLSIAPIGGHYIVDVFSGGAIALLCILGSRWANINFAASLGRDRGFESIT
jgi:hypothetical protein